MLDMSNDTIWGGLMSSPPWSDFREMSCFRCKVPQTDAVDQSTIKSGLGQGIYDVSPSRRLYEPEAVIAGSTCPPSSRSAGLRRGGRVNRTPTGPHRRRDMFKKLLREISFCVLLIGPTSCFTKMQQNAPPFKEGMNADINDWVVNISRKGIVLR